MQPTITTGSSNGFLDILDNSVFRETQPEEVRAIRNRVRRFRQRQGKRAPYVPERVYVRLLLM